MSHRPSLAIILAALAVLLLLAANIFIGSVSIPFRDTIAILSGHDTTHTAWQFILFQSRIPAAITALMAGTALAASGLMLQTSFSNPLAGPDILGINSGAGLGVAIVMLASGGLTVLTSPFSTVAAAFIGALAVTGIMLFISSFVRSHSTLLIVGLMISYLVSSFVTLLNFFSTAEGVQSYLLWGMGNFGSIPLSHLPMFCGITLAGLLLCLCLIKPLNALLLGQHYAESLGINIRRVRFVLLLTTGLLVAVTTAYCGPISFIGLAVPHIARLLLSSNDHRRLMPTTMLCGAGVALLCNLLCSLPGESRVLPLGAITPLIGAPIVIFVILKQRSK